MTTRFDDLHTKARCAISGEADAMIDRGADPIRATITSSAAAIVAALVLVAEHPYRVEQAGRRVVPTPLS